MRTKIDVTYGDNLTADLHEELLATAMDEGFVAMRLLQEDWDIGVNRFSEPGEALYDARIHDRLVGVCGMNRDPYVKDSTIGQLRRLYELPGQRRKGVGRTLVLRALEDARSAFRAVHLRTINEQSAAFFKAIGFTPVRGVEGCTHIKVFESCARS
jgi:GNAT superfamily N-acetyltransferase